MHDITPTTYWIRNEKKRVNAPTNAAKYVIKIEAVF